MSERIDVMISSTARDLPDHRREAESACQKLGMFPVIMEDLGAKNEDAIQASLKMVEDAEIYVGIFAYRYGYIPDGHAISITEMEYNHAVKLGIPRLIFMVADDHYPALPKEGEPGASKLQAFKDRVGKDRVSAFFKSHHDLRAHLLQALMPYRPTTFIPREPPPPDTLPERGEIPPGSNFDQLANYNFVGREADLQAIAQCLLHNPNGKAMGVTAAMGAGGIGKTQLAIEFAYRYGRFFHGVHWLSAISDRLDPEIARCGYAMDLPDFPDKQDAQIERVLAEWAKSSPRLIIVDNAEKPEALKEWLPRLQSHRILITSRRGQWPPSWGVVAHRLDVLTPAQSRDLLRRLAPHLTTAADPELNDVAEKLGRLPLALDLAGNYIHFRRMTPAAYLALLDKQKSLVDNRLFTTWAVEAGIINPTDHDQNLYANFDLSWQRLTSDAPKRLLIGCGYLAPNTPIPLDLLTVLFDGADDPAETRDMALIQLDNVGLLNRKEDGLPAIHPLIADFARLQVGERDDTLTVLVDRMKGMSEVAQDTDIPADFTPLSAHVRRLAEQAELAGNADAGSLWNIHGYDLHHMLGDYAGARAAFERALRIDEAVYGPDHYNIAKYVNNLGDLLREMGDYSGARNCLERALLTWETIYGEYDPHVAICLNNLGLLLKSQRELFAAKVVVQRAIRIGEATFGPQHPEVAVWINNLGLVLKDMGNLSGAKSKLIRAQQILEVSFGPNHPKVASGLWNLGELFFRMRELATAKKLLEQALRIYQQVLPPSHPYIQGVQDWLDLVNRELSGGG
ncbi:MAG: tetratricopeptide repeat protein [Anaerolineae bacterium]|nr:tetratricopeptide repeat protein [Anaerolineae bacterium]